MQLETSHLIKSVAKLPEVVITLLKKYPKDLMVAGGYFRAIYHSEESFDIDLFTTSKEISEKVANDLAELTSHKVKKTENSYYVKTNPIIQVIHKFVYPTAKALIESFDFTITCAALWWDEGWKSEVLGSSEWFSEYYMDLEGKLLNFRFPEREDEAMSGILRVIKFAKKGYHVPRTTLGGVIGRAAAKLNLAEVKVDSNDKVALPWAQSGFPDYEFLTLEKKYANVITDSISDMTGVS